MRSPYRTRAQLVIILSMWVVIERLYVRVTPRTEMRWTLSKPCTVGGGRSVCRQDLGLVNTISLDLDRLNFFHCFIALDETCNIERGHPNFGFTLIYAFFSRRYAPKNDIHIAAFSDVDIDRQRSSRPRLPEVLQDGDL